MIGGEFMEEKNNVATETFNSSELIFLIVLISIFSFSSLDVMDFNSAENPHLLFSMIISSFALELLEELKFFSK